ncbi:MAG TPA: tetratricopeptide repeat protein [Arenimonas sp.]|nr:tetratricopeptide repeat protein [Arenimonas sp.]
MSVFIVIAIILLIALLLIALFPIWNANRKLAASLILGSSIFVASLYILLGKPNAIDYLPTTEQQTIDQALVELENHIKEQPNDIEALVLLARSQMQMGEYTKAQKNFAAAIKIQADNSNLLVDYAESFFRATPPNQASPDAKLWIEKALALEPNNQRALFFQGVLLMQDKQPAKAAEVWERLLPQVDENTAKALLPQINSAREQAGLAEIALPEQQSIQILVELSPELQAQALPGQTLFVFAKTLDGAGPPIAAKRIEISKFPITVSLSDSDSIMPTAKLFSQNEFNISARISVSGSAESSAQDWQSATTKVQLSDKQPIRLIIDNKP